MIGLPDLTSMTPEKFIMWIAAAAFVFVLWGVDSKLDAMKDEHSMLLRIDQIQCYNHAENNTNLDKRADQQRRCLTVQLSKLDGSESKP